MSDKKEKIKRFFPALYNIATNPNLKALVEAVGNEDDKNVQEIKNAKDQIFVDTAVDRYLDALGANLGIERPFLNTFIVEDPTFRKVIKIMSFAPKQVKDTMFDLLEAFFNDDPKIKIQEINPNEIVVQLPRTLVSERETLRGTSHFKSQQGIIKTVDNTSNKEVTVQFESPNLKPLPDFPKFPHAINSDTETVGWKLENGTRFEYLLPKSPLDYNAASLGFALETPAVLTLTTYKDVLASDYTITDSYTDTGLSVTMDLVADEVVDFKAEGMLRSGAGSAGCSVLFRLMAGAEELYTWYTAKGEAGTNWRVPFNCNFSGKVGTHIAAGTGVVIKLQTYYVGTLNNGAIEGSYVVTEDVVSDELSSDHTIASVAYADTGLSVDVTLETGELLEGEVSGTIHTGASSGGMAVLVRLISGSTVLAVGYFNTADVGSNLRWPFTVQFSGVAGTDIDAGSHTIKAQAYYVGTTTGAVLKGTGDNKSELTMRIMD